jgi:hypothetical protein
MDKRIAQDGDSDTKAPETQKNVFRGAHRTEDQVPSDRDESRRGESDSEGQPTEAPGAGFPHPEKA